MLRWYFSSNGRRWGCQCRNSWGLCACRDAVCRRRWILQGIKLVFGKSPSAVQVCSLSKMGQWPWGHQCQHFTCMASPGPLTQEHNPSGIQKFSFWFPVSLLHTAGLCSANEICKTPFLKQHDLSAWNRSERAGVTLQCYKRYAYPFGFFFLRHRYKTGLIWAFEKKISSISNHAHTHIHTKNNLSVC